MKSGLKQACKPLKIISPTASWIRHKFGYEIPFHFEQVPVYKGADRALVHGGEMDYFCGQKGLGNIPESPNPVHDDLLQKEHAVNAFIRIANENPGTNRQHAKQQSANNVS